MNIENDFIKFFNTYDFVGKANTWKKHQSTFIKIWNDKILQGKGEIKDFDDLVFIIDANARNSTKKDEAVARTYIRYPIWYKLFNDLNEKTELREKVNQLLQLSGDDEIISSINELYSFNKDNKNGLTTKSAIILNAFLFLKNPDKYLTSLSLNHRANICEKLNIKISKNSIGEEIIYSNIKIIEYFTKFISNHNLDPNQIFIKNRMISDFIYSSAGNSIFWSGEDIMIEDKKSEDSQDDSGESQDFYLEKHLENFLYTNWGKIPELRDYDFIVNEDDEPVSLQYKTDVGVIDLFVKHKNDQSYLVIELKRAKTSDQTVGQIARYMGWVKKKMLTDEITEVKGLIIAESFDDKIKYASSLIDNLKLLKYKIDFKLEYEDI